MRLLVFLGNPGKKYEHTRHNAGFLLGDFLQKKWGFSTWKEEKKFFGQVCEGYITGGHDPMLGGVRGRVTAGHDPLLREKGNEKILFLKPQTFMNLSGQSVQAIASFYKITPEEILILVDDKDLPFGTLRYREKGSSGGHNGLKDIFRALGTEDIARIKIGVFSSIKERFENTADFVLAPFLESEQNALETEIFPEVEKKMEELFKTNIVPI
ncbi:MAG: aminoacyl-tRNA hydrolase [Candidatus Peregrinibacteria bacterium]